MYLHNVQEARLHKLMYKNQHETLPIKAWEYKVHVVASWLAIFNLLKMSVCLLVFLFFVCHLGVVIILPSITVKFTILQLQSFINAQMYDNFTNVHFYQNIFQLNTPFIFVPLKS